MKKKVIVLGVSGMLGSTLSLNLKTKFKIYAVYNRKKVSFLDQNTQNRFVNIRNVSNLIKRIKPHFIVNCIGIIPQNKSSQNTSKILYINGKLPHEIVRNIRGIDCQFIQISTDCVYNGTNGNRKETEIPDADGLYGKSKINGEMNDSKNLTIRTSIIGHEINRKNGLLEWFLTNNGKQIEGYKNALFSGLTTLELSSILSKYMTSKKKYYGIYQISGPKINKYDLLCLINKTYKKQITIKKNTNFKIDRSLNSEKAINQRLYVPKAWVTMIKEQYEFYKKNFSIFD